MKSLQYIPIDRFLTQSGKHHDLKLSYQCFGQPLGRAPVVLVNHALTGNSNVSGETGWWKELIGAGTCIDTNHYSVLAFNVPGNGFDANPEHGIEAYTDFTAKDIAYIFYQGIDRLGITALYAILGGSLGGGVAWEMTALRPNFVTHLIAVGADWKSTDWVIANCKIQDELLNSGEHGMALARKHAMTLYRNPIAFRKKFKRSTADQAQYQVEAWLDFHAKTLEGRFQPSSYKMMNQLLRTIHVAASEEAFLQKMEKVTSSIHMVTITTDLLFSPEENYRTHEILKKLGKEVQLLPLESHHGHDAFLIEHDKLSQLLSPIFNRIEVTVK